VASAQPGADTLARGRVVVVSKPFRVVKKTLGALTIAERPPAGHRMKDGLDPDGKTRPRPEVAHHSQRRAGRWRLAARAVGKGLTGRPCLRRGPPRPPGFIRRLACNFLPSQDRDGTNVVLRKVVRPTGSRHRIYCACEWWRGGDGPRCCPPWKGGSWPAPSVEGRRQPASRPGGRTAPRDGELSTCRFLLGWRRRPRGEHPSGTSSDVNVSPDRRGSAMNNAPPREVGRRRRPLAIKPGDW